MSDELGRIQFKRQYLEFVVNYDEEPWIESLAKANAWRETTLQNDEFAPRYDRAVQVIDEALERFR